MRIELAPHLPFACKESQYPGVGLNQQVGGGLFISAFYGNGNNVESTSQVIGDGLLNAGLQRIS